MSILYYRYYYRYLYLFIVIYIQSPFLLQLYIVCCLHIDKKIFIINHTTLHFIEEHLFPRITAFWSIFAINTRSGCCVTCCRGWRCSVCGVIKIPYWYIAVPGAVIAPPATALLYSSNEGSRRLREVLQSQEKARILGLVSIVSDYCVGIPI